ncbi:MAG: hypothetical protein Q8O29_15375 [Polaromonas sp.]|uniref:hypothetical protein n=1 Tax=Polaromonas sp. TaxID=1869339 RepID=UPI0027343C0E|nr:hypothetical protein [Polaromonas sp.]MDP2819616.1 hypothetical protein [Polaromonas sp.]
MKKPVLAKLGVVGACAACCAIPLAIPLMAGMSITGLALFEPGYFNFQSELLVIAVGVAAAALVAGGMWLVRRRRGTCQTDADAPACSTGVSKDASSAACACARGAA